MKIKFFAHASLLLAGCLSSASPGSTLPDDYFSYQDNCYRQWEKVLQEWHSSGGGIADSIRNTREHSIRQNSSKFSRDVRQIWDKQETRNSDIPFGAWPIDDDDYRRVISATFDVFNGSVSEGCESVVWLGPLLWDEARKRIENGESDSPLKDMPREVAKNPHSAASWMIYWIFVK
jgi:hypothetical protein